MTAVTLGRINSGPSVCSAEIKVIIAEKEMLSGSISRVS